MIHICFICQSTWIRSDLCRFDIRLGKNTAARTLQKPRRRGKPDPYRVAARKAGHSPRMSHCIQRLNQQELAIQSVSCNWLECWLAWLETHHGLQSPRWSSDSLHGGLGSTAGRNGALAGGAQLQAARPPVCQPAAHAAAAGPFSACALEDSRLLFVSSTKDTPGGCRQDCTNMPRMLQRSRAFV